MKTLTRVAATIGAAATLAFGAGPAMAASSNGAQVFNTSDCQDLGYAVICETVKGEMNGTSTPSGNLSAGSNGRYSYTVTFPDGETYSDSGVVHLHQLFKDGVPQVFSDHFSDTFTSTGYGTCTYTGAVHYANGQYQFNTASLVCVP